LTRDAKEHAAGKRRLLLRLALVAVLIGTGFVLVRFTPVGEYFERDRLIALLDDLHDRPWTPFALVASYGVTTPIGLPASPLVMAGGMVFGPVLGSVYNILGLMLGAMSAFWIGRGLGRDAVVQLAGPKLRRAEAVFQKHSFWPLVQSRFLPIPFPVVSYAAALAGVSGTRFFVTTLIGMVPATVLHSYFGPKLILLTLSGGDPLPTLVVYSLGVAVLNGLAAWPQIRTALRRKRRYRELTRVRSARTAPD
jgi:uncharacterized membrane protein YdjX (TVP38/TMEM64 family)